MIKANKTVKTRISIDRGSIEEVARNILRILRRVFLSFWTNHLADFFWIF